MRMRLFLIIAAFMFSFSISIDAQEFVLDTAQDSVAITTGFTGEHLNVFGQKPNNLDVVVVLEGPKKDTVVRRKAKVLGIWLNADSIKFNDVPAFYDMRGSLSVLEKIKPMIREEEGIGLNYLRFKTDNKRKDSADILRFREALVQNKQFQNLYLARPMEIESVTDTFFKTEFKLPSNIPRGNYTLKGYLIDENGAIVYRSEKTFNVEQDGLNADVYLYSLNNPFLYGIFGVLMAIFLGWGATEILRRD